MRAKVVVTNPDAAVSDWYSRATVRKVVRRAAHFTCNLTGADVPTTVKLTFTIPFKPATA